ncbi:zinc-binding dehydrogenase [Sediminitomix flava]|uniref:NADPH:quinone reductase-like Zn-dependent oxidoreductase n=1 Tax=Sediminitomix flava TaxID=379075 RepID=A0A315ZAV9_SEDFL|nr:zinc-binding dehydrogenase [Sediminitomix flava]PWJ41958.1 NADPH:quinone reductase-like Zn-dependent oxidoreductase [Sediminitomix flava]
MKALTFNPSTDEFSIKQLNKPSPSATEVLVKVEACGLNPVDAKVRFWKSMIPDQMNDNWVVGLDVVGTIEEVGSEVSDWKVGDKVQYHGNMSKPHGGLAEYAIHESSSLIKCPEKFSVEEVAAMPCAGWTAWRALVDKLQVDHTDSLLVIGGSGGVGSLAVQIAKYALNCPNIIGVCSTDNVEFVRKMGAHHVIDYKTEDILEKVKEYTNQKGVTKALDAVGGDNDIIAANALAFEGQMVELVGTVRPKEYDNAFMKGLGFHQLSLGAGHGYDGGKTIVEAGKAFNKAWKAGKICIPQLQTISLEEAGDALVKILDKRTVGKIVVKM